MIARSPRFGWISCVRRRIHQIKLRIRVLIVAGRVLDVRRSRFIDRRSGVGVGLVVRDGSEFIDAFLRHHLALGVDRITVLDNGSRDDTVKRALAYGPRVEVLACSLPFARWETAMKSYLVRRAADGGRWALLVDVDELFDFPGRDTLSLNGLVSYFDSQGWTGMVSHLLDVFPVELDPQTKVGEHENYRCFELDHVVSIDYADFASQHEILVDTRDADGMVFKTNGFRHHFLGFEGPLWITKHALVNPNAGVWLSHPHLVQGAVIAPISAVLAHYSLTSGTLEKARIAVAEGRYGGTAQDEYTFYASKLGATRPVRLAGPRTLEYQNPNQLVDLGFLQIERRSPRDASKQLDTSRQLDTQEEGR